MQTVQTADTSAGFHVYSVDWEPHRTTFRVDGQVVATARTPASMNTPMYIPINLAVGGDYSWPGPPDAGTKMPAWMEVDWVRAYATENTRSLSGRRAQSGDHGLD